MPRIHAATDALDGDSLVLEGEAAHYLVRVLRLGPGEKVCLFDGRGTEVDATIERAGARAVTLTLGARSFVAPALAPPVTLLQGLPRADRMELIVQKATELGAARVIPVRTERTAAGQQGRLERWQRIAREAERQCGRSTALALSEVVSLAEALGAIGDEVRHRFMPWEEDPKAPSLHQLLEAARRGPAGPGGKIGDAIGEATGGVALFIGPEGGLGAAEANLAMRAGFQVATLGPRILRTETAAIAVLAIAQALVGGLGPV
jgi:16S rRNA (uracil1498-N3)-methyltransferase